MDASYTTELPAIVSKPKTCHWQGKYRLVTYLPIILYFIILQCAQHSHDYHSSRETFWLFASLAPFTSSNPIRHKILFGGLDIELLRVQINQFFWNFQMTSKIFLDIVAVITVSKSRVNKWLNWHKTWNNYFYRSYHQKVQIQSSLTNTVCY